MYNVTGPSGSQLAGYEREARDLIAKYDRYADGTIQQDELQRFTGSDSSSYSTRQYYNRDYVNVTTVYRDNYSGIKQDAFRAADRDHNGRLTSHELVEAFLEDADTNHDRSLSGWEKFKLGFRGVAGMFEDSWSVETRRNTRTVYDPLPDYDRPTPPYVDPRPYRPTPPSVDPRPYRPSPPSVDPRPYRPTPPPVNHDRPTPPPVYRDRPEPPRVDPRNDRPAPPSVNPSPRKKPNQGNDRPEPPRI